ncbi:MAG TPA: N-acetylmuramoyl-L-alanine amidase [Terriglobales bacterium]|nr:N-acetylmuramoyl-L-alanine amidase [Terriglobales bacterium]
MRLVSRGLAVLLLLSLAVPAATRNVKQKKQTARTQFETALRMREALNGKPTAQRTRRDYQRVTDAFRKVYYVAPTSPKANESVVAVAELLAESGRVFDDPKSSKDAIKQYEFLRREYPGSRYRAEALFTIGQIYHQDLDDPIQAKATFQEFLKHYPSSRLAEQARAEIEEIDAPKNAGKKKPAPAPRKQLPEEQAKEADEQPAPAKARSGLPLVTGIRHWSTPDYTRVAIDLEQEVKYEAGRVSGPDRIFFDLHDTKLASELVGKTFDVEDGFLKKIRVAPYQRGITRVVLEVDELAEYSAFLLPDPYRLVVDIHGRQQPKMMAKAQPPTPEAKNTVKEAVKPAESKPEAKKSEPTAKEAKAAEAPAPSPARSKPAEPAPAVKEKAKETAAKVIDDAAAPDIAKSEPTVKDTAKPTTGPTFEAVAPRSKGKRHSKTGAVQDPNAREAQPAANGERSLIRALGLKIGRIVVDAGHGGHDTGTVGPKGLEEKDLVLDVALRLGKLLENRMGAEVVYTRDDDTFVPLETRTAIANKEEADLFISIHANSSSDSSARGVETYYLNFTSSADALEVAARENAVSEKSIHELQDLVKKIALKEKIEESREFATDVQKSLATGLSTRSSSMRNRGVKKAPFIVLIGANMPSILAEVSFVSNPADEKKLMTPEWRQKIAESLYRGMAKYVSGLSGVKVAAKLNKDSGQ